MVNELLKLEAAVLTMLLDGTHPALVALRQQLVAARVKSRKLSGVGFFIEFNVPQYIEAAPIKNKNTHFGDVIAKLPNLHYGAGFLLFIKDGKLDMLEGYSYDEPWPKQVTKFKLEYTDATRQQTLQILS
jgi:hypothetical protein